MKVAWLLVLGFAVLGVIVGFRVLTSAETVMQEMEGLGFAVTFAVVPYVMVKAIGEIARDDD